MLACLVTRPIAFATALLSALHFARGSLRPLPLHLVYLAEACPLQRWLRTSGCDHLHAHFGTNATAVAYLFERLGGPGFSFTVHRPQGFDMPVAEVGQRAHQRAAARHSIDTEARKLAAHFRAATAAA